MKHKVPKRRNPVAKQMGRLHRAQVLSDKKPPYNRKKDKQTWIHTTT